MWVYLFAVSVPCFPSTIRFSQFMNVIWTLVYFIFLWYWLIHSYPSGLFQCNWDSHINCPSASEANSGIWVNVSHESTKNYDLAIIKHSAWACPTGYTIRNKIWCNWKCHLQGMCHFVQASICLIVVRFCPLVQDETAFIIWTVINKPSWEKNHPWQ